MPHYSGRWKPLLIWLVTLVIVVSVTLLLLLSWEWAPDNILVSVLLPLGLLTTSVFSVLKLVRSRQNARVKPAYSHWYVLLVVLLAVIAAWQIDIVRVFDMKNYGLPTRAMEPTLQVDAHTSVFESPNALE